MTQICKETNGKGCHYDISYCEDEGFCVGHVYYTGVECISPQVDNGLGGCLFPQINDGDGPHNTCQPINIATANKFYRHVDSHGNGSLQLAMAYNSQSPGWSFLYRQKLVIQSNSILSERPDGKHIRFTVEAGTFVAPSQRRERVEFNGSIYTLVLPDSSVETYDVNGRLLSINKLHESPITLAYASNQIIVRQGNEELRLTTNIDNQVVQAILPDGDTVSYTYIVNNENLLLSTVTYADNSARHYFYDDPRFPAYITGIEDENGNRISSVQYDDQGRAISSEKGPLNSGIERTQIAYHADGTRTVTNALGKQSTYHFTQFNGEYKMTQVEGHPSANCTGANKAYTYDANGFLASKTDWKNNLTTYVHNDRGQELSRTEASGTPQARTITTEWHATFNLPVRIAEPERETIMRYDTNGRLQSRELRERSDL